MSAAEVVVVPTGVANLASVLAAIERLGGRPRLAQDAAAIAEASHVILPGVGTFGATMAGLQAAGLDQALAARIRQGAATFAMCVGLQVLFESSEESPGVAGLGVITGSVQRFPASVRVPQFGWNRIEPAAGCHSIEPGYAYFANSYRALAAPGWATAEAEHGGRFVAAIERDQVIACQFHPELSAAYGHRLLGRWLEG